MVSQIQSIHDKRGRAQVPEVYVEMYPTAN